jgi:hypothetical protein
MAPVYPIRTLVDQIGVNRIEYRYDELPDSKAESYEFSYRLAEIAYSFKGKTLVSDLDGR